MHYAHRCHWVIVACVTPLGSRNGAVCSQAQDNNRRHEMTFAEYAAYWRQRDVDDRLLYLKDWHFANEFPSYQVLHLHWPLLESVLEPQEAQGWCLLQAYTCPPFFQDDWLNDYYDMRHNAAEPAPSQHDVITSDYRFVYLGPKVSKVVACIQGRSGGISLPERNAPKFTGLLGMGA